MNYKSISMAILATLALTSCKKEAGINPTGTVTEQTDKPVTVAEPKVVDPNAKYGKMDFASLEHDFGQINGDDKVETTFTFTNNGEADILISDAKGSCGCTVPEYPKEPIAPGEKGEIKVSFSPKGKNGMQHKTVTLFTNTAAGFEKLSVKANIVK